MAKIFAGTGKNGGMRIEHEEKKPCWSTTKEGKRVWGIPMWGSTNKQEEK